MANFTWNGSANDGNYGNPANWTPNGVPGPADTATISTTAAASINAGNAAAGSLSTTSQITLNVADSSSFTFGAGTGTATFSNGGTFALNSTNDPTSLVVGDSLLTLSGAGTILLGNDTANSIYGASATDTLSNGGNLIEGAGQLGAGTLTFINGASGIVDANQSNALVLNTGTIAVSNAGVLEATAGAILDIQSSVTETGAGRIAAAGGTVELQSGATLQGGTLATNAGGAIAVAGGQTATLSALTSTGSVQVGDGGTLSLLGTIVNNGAITLGSTNDATGLLIGPGGATSGTVTLTGGGAVTLSDNAGNVILGTAAADTLNNVNNTISGAGTLGNGQLTLINGAAGIIDATGSNALTLATNHTVTNSGLIEATGAGGLILQTDTISNAAGTVLAAGSTVSLQNSVNITGGLVKSTGPGAIQVAYNESGTLTGSAKGLTIAGSVQVSDEASLNLLGGIVNTGTISLLSTNDATQLTIASPTVTLTGAGSVVLSDNINNYIFGLSAGDTLDNVSNIISGAGHIGAGQLVLVNGTAGTIDATGSNALILSTGNTDANNGLIEATGAGGLLVQGDTISNASGTVLAAGSTVSLQYGASIAGGQVTTTGAGVIEVTNSQSGTLDGSDSPLAIAGNVQVADGGSLSLLGSIANTGTISLLSTGDATGLVIASPTVTLTGAGSLVLSDNANNAILGAAATDTLDNVNNTIEGSGNLGDGQLTLINSGTIAATGSNALTISLGSTGTTGSVGSTGTNTATGQLLAIGTGGLSVQNGTYTNAGLIQADSGSNLTFTAGASLTNDSSSGTLTGGTYAASGGVNGATLAITGAAVTTDAADIVLSGAASSITFGGTALENSLATIAARSELQILSGRSYTTTLALASNGTVTLGGGKLSAKSLTTRVGSLLSGFGTISGALLSNGSLAASGGALVLTSNDQLAGPVSGTGTLTFSADHVTLADANPITVSNIAMINAATLALTKSLSFAGTFAIVGASGFSGAGTVTTSGLFEQTGHGTAKIATPFASSGTISTVSLGTLAFSGGLTNTGTILDNGGFTDTAPLTGGSLYIGTAGATAVLASASGSGNSTVSTLSLVTGTLNTSGTAVTVTGDYINDATGSGNSYNPDAHVTGIIDAQGTAMSIVGVEGTSVQTVNGTLTIMVSAGGSAHFEIENTGSAGSTTLRGALQTTVGGGSITGTALSGNGVTAANFSPIVAGGRSGIYTINDNGGTLTNEAIHLASDFANVAGLTFDIVASPPPGKTPPAATGTHLPDAVSAYVLPGFHHA